jgi:hypothetical protein
MHPVSWAVLGARDIVIDGAAAAPIVPEAPPPVLTDQQLGCLPRACEGSGLLARHASPPIWSIRSSLPQQRAHEVLVTRT